MSNSQQSINLENGSRGKNLQQVLIEKLMIVSKDDSGLLKLLQDIAHDPDGTSLSLHEKFYPIRLPRKIEDLVGRQVEQERITKYLLAHRSVIIYGQEGIGKTYLGNVVAHHVKDKKCFPGGIVWPCHEVGVDECSTEEVLDYIASSYGNTEILTKKDHKTALGKLSELLKEEEALIVLDLKLDDHSLQEIVQAIPYPCTLLLIHRTRVSGMIDVSLGALDHKSAVGLFMRLSEHPNQIGNSAFWKRRAISGGICFWRRYVPAAITAEATLASNYGKGLEKYWVKFLIELQEEQEAKNNSVFHQTLIKIERPIRSFLGKTETSFPGDSALILFWEELSDSCKRILTSLGEFRAGASEDALQTVSGLIGDDLKKNLEHLINIKIVQTSSPRYHLPPYIKRWIRAKKIPKDDPEVGSRVAKYFYRFTLQHQDQPDPDNIKALDLERANIKASLDWYRNTQSKDHLVNYIIALSQYWLVTYRWREYVYRLDDLLEFEQQIDDPIIKAWAHHQRGSIRLCQDDLDEAQKHLEIASSILRNENKENLNIRTGLTKTLHNFGVLYESQNNIENAARCYGESLSLHRPNDLPTAQYLESFLNQGPDNRNWGIEGIDLFDRERALHLRLQDLKDDSTQIRSHAVRGLQKYEDSRAIKGLVSVLQDTNEDIVCEAVTGLGKIGDQSVSPELSRLWSNSSNKVRLSLVDALGQLHHRWGDTATLTSLANGLNDPNPGVISKAVQILKTTSPRPEAAMTYIVSGQIK